MFVFLRILMNVYLIDETFGTILEIHIWKSLFFIRLASRLLTKWSNDLNVEFASVAAVTRLLVLLARHLLSNFGTFKLLLFFINLLFYQSIYTYTDLFIDWVELLHEAGWLGWSSWLAFQKRANKAKPTISLSAQVM